VVREAVAVTRFADCVQSVRVREEGPDRGGGSSRLGVRKLVLAYQNVPEAAAGE